jgi:putative transposase
MSLWQGDWKLLNLNGEEKWVIAFMDGASRWMKCYGVFDEATTENTIKVLKKGFAGYRIPDEILTDNRNVIIPNKNRMQLGIKP